MLEPLLKWHWPVYPCASQYIPTSVTLSLCQSVYPYIRGINVYTAELWPVYHSAEGISIYQYNHQIVAEDGFENILGHIIWIKNFTKMAMYFTSKWSKNSNTNDRSLVHFLADITRYFYIYFSRGKWPKAMAQFESNRQWLDDMLFLLQTNRAMMKSIEFQLSW